MILQHDAPRVNPQSTSEFLRANPLPPDLAHLEETIRALPDVESMLNIVFGCAAVGFSDAQIGEALHRAAAHAQQKAHRCACCLAWREGGTTFARAGAGVVELVVVCRSCEALIEAGRVTPTMRRNLHVYGFGGAA